MHQLYPFQQEAVDQLCKRGNTLLADEMGLGKTVQALSFINADRSIKRVLIICPKNVVPTWVNERREWLSPRPGLMVRITNYEQADEDCLLLFRGHEIDLLILDESQYVMNAAAKRSQRVALLAMHSKRLLLISGTPLQSRPIELWNQLCLLEPGKWNNEVLMPQLFQIRYGKLMIKDMRTVPPNWVESTVAAHHAFGLLYCGAKRKSIGRGRFGRKYAWDYSGASREAELAARIEHLIIRRTKAQVFGQMSRKTRQVVLFDGRWDDDDLIPELADENFEDCISRLRGDSVAFEKWSQRRHEQGIAKVPIVIEHVKNVLREERQVIVFAHHRDVIQELRNGLQPFGLVSITGETDVEERNQAVQLFQDRKVRAFIGSIKAAGVGITLTAASTVIFAEIDPVLAAMEQAEDRADRIGQTMPVTAQYLLFDGTLDARICKILMRKKRIIDRIMVNR